MNTLGILIITKSLTYLIPYYIKLLLESLELLTIIMIKSALESTQHTSQTTAGVKAGSKPGP